MGDRADAAPAPPGGLRVGGDADLGARLRPGDVGGVAVARLHTVMVVARRHEDDRLSVRGAQHPLGVGRDQGAPGEHAEIHGLEVGEQGVVALDRHHRLPRLDRCRRRGAPRRRAQSQSCEQSFEDRDRLVHAAEHRAAALEHLHQDARVTAVGEQRGARVVEVGIRVVALPHLLDRQVEHARVEPLVRAALDGRLMRHASAARQAASAASATSSWAAEGSAVETRACSSWPGRASARETGWSGWRPIQPKTSTAAPTAPIAPTARAVGPGPGGRAGRERARRRAREQERADEVTAAAVVLLRGRLSRLVGADRDVLGAVVGGELAALQGDGGGDERGNRRDGLAGGEAEPRAARDAGRRGTGDDGNCDAWPLEREAGLGQRPPHVGEDGECLGQAQGPSDEGRRHVRREASLGAGGGADGAVGSAHGRAPRRGPMDEDPVRESHASEPQLLHAVRVP